VDGPTGAFAVRATIQRALDVIMVSEQTNPDFAYAILRSHAAATAVPLAAARSILTRTGDEQREPEYMSGLEQRTKPDVGTLKDPPGRAKANADQTSRHTMWSTSDTSLRMQAEGCLDACYMPNRACRTASIAASVPLISTCAALRRPKR
jgi:hypothetical protein